MAETARDRIHIRDLRLRCIIGVFDYERTEKQDVILNVTMHTDLSGAGRSDDLRDTVDYKAVKKDIMQAVEASEFQLVERLAERVAEIVLSHGVERVDVTVDKPGALRFARSVAVEITRTRSI
jgi:dihydroneopterin aldolase/D-erythro-7,8-dihydroneopterin triphosphate epimerase